MNTTLRATLPLLALVTLLPLTTSCGMMGANLAQMSTATQKKSYDYTVTTKSNTHTIWSKTDDGAKYLGAGKVDHKGDVKVLEDSTYMDVFLGAGTIVDMGILGGGLYVASESQSDAGAIAGGVMAAVGLGALILDAGAYYVKRTKDIPAPGNRAEDSFFIRSANGTWYEAKPKGTDVILGKVKLDIKDLKTAKTPKDLQDVPKDGIPGDKANTTTDEQASK